MPPDEAPTGTPGNTPPKSPQEVRTEAIRAYFEAKTAEERKAAVSKYPLLKHIFAEGNHH